MYTFSPVILFGVLDLAVLALLPEGNQKMLFGIFVFISFYGINTFFTNFLISDPYQFILIGSFFSAMTINSFLIFLSIILLNFIKSTIASYGGPKLVREFLINNARKKYVKKMNARKSKQSGNEQIYDNLMFKEGDAVLVTNFFKSIIFWAFFYLFLILYILFFIAMPLKAIYFLD